MRPGQWRDRGDHRRMSARGCRIGAGLLRPRKRRAMRLLLQRDRGDGRGRRGTARRRRDRGGPGPVTPLVCGASWPRGGRDARRRDKRRREPVGEVPRRRREPSRQWLPDMPTQRVRGRASLPGRGGEPGLRIRLDRTICDGFGVCAQHAPEYFSLDDWGYASLEGNGEVADGDRDAVKRALLDCPVHAITEWG